MRHRILLSFFIVLIFESPLLAQNKYNFSQFTHETGEFFSRPPKWGGNDWLKVGIIAAGTVLVMQIDQPIRDAVLRGKGRYNRHVSTETGRFWGEWYTPPVVSAGFGLHGWLAKNSSSKKVGFELIQASVYADVITQFLKIAIGRARPYQNEGPLSFHPFSFAGVGFQSLPGGHSTNGLAMSTVLSRNARSPVLKVLAYVPAALTFASRVYHDKHWTSDDLTGGAIGILVAYWVVDLHRRKELAVQGSALSPFTLSFRF